MTLETFVLIMTAAIIGVLPLSILAFTPEMAKSDKWWIVMFSIPRRWNLGAVLLFIMMLMCELTAFSFLCLAMAAQ